VVSLDNSTRCTVAVKKAEKMSRLVEGWQRLFVSLEVLWLRSGALRPVGRCAPVLARSIRWLTYTRESPSDKIRAMTQT
jgi:hypothetical protein